jgi:hypothetical protein
MCVMKNLLRFAAATASAFAVSPLAAYAEDRVQRTGETAWKASTPVIWLASAPELPPSANRNGRPMSGLPDLKPEPDSAPAAATKVERARESVTIADEPAIHIPVPTWEHSEKETPPKASSSRVSAPDRLPMDEPLDAPQIAPPTKIDVLPAPTNNPRAAIILPPGQSYPGTTTRPGRIRSVLHDRGGSEVGTTSQSTNGDGCTLIEALNPHDERLTVRGEYLLWWVRNQRIPVLGTTGPTSTGGVLGAAGTQSLFGLDPDQSQRSGARFYAGLWLNDDRTLGIDSTFFFLPRRQSSQVVSSDTFSVISRPVFVLNSGSENVEIVAFPGFSTGSLRVENSSQLWGIDGNIVRRLCTRCDRTIDVFAGYRYLYLSESITISESITAGAGAPDPVGTQVLVQDSFATKNHFHGGQVGARFEQRFDRFYVEFRPSIALGVNQQSLDIDGLQVRTRPGEAPQRFVGGLLAARSNIGHHTQSEFSAIPEVNLNVGYQITPRVRAFVGYSFLYWTSVIRPGDQIDRVVDLTQIPNTPPVPSTGQLRPGVLFKETNFWAQGVNVGLQWVW